MLRMIRAGVPYKHVAGAHGVTYDCFQRWRVRGRDAIAVAQEHDTPIPPDTEKYVRFFEGVARAREEGMAALLTLWRQQAATDWRAAKALLAVHDPGTYAERSRFDVTITGGGLSEGLPDGASEASVRQLPDIDRADRLLAIAAESGLLDPPASE